jgi:hypothetical protein
MAIQAVAVQTLALAIGNGASPEIFTIVANIESMAQAGQTRTVDVSNVTNPWQIWVPTLLEAGKITLVVFWVMDDPTHDSQALGLRGLWQSKTLSDMQIRYPLSGGGGYDTFQAYVTKYSWTGKVADVFKATIELSVSGQPNLV